MKYLRTYEKYGEEKDKDKLKSKIQSAKHKLKNLTWSDIREFGNKAWDFMKNESNETKQAAEILKRMINGKDVSDNEKRFLREQSKDLIRILGTGTLPSPIIAILVILGKKYNFKVFPGNQEELKELIRKEKEELGITIEDLEKED